MIGLNVSRQFINQSEEKTKLIVTESHAFSRAWRWLHVFTSSSDWFIGFSASLVIARVITLALVYDTLLKTTLCLKNP